MRFLEQILIAATLMVVSASVAMAQSFSGNWPATVSHSHRNNGAVCLMLTENGTLGWPHSGPAKVAGHAFGGTLVDGTFQLIDNTLVATIQEPSNSGQNACLVFTAPAGNGNIGKGAFDQVYGGVEFDSGLLVFGVKGGC